MRYKKQGCGRLRAHKRKNMEAESCKGIFAGIFAP